MCRKADTGERVNMEVLETHAAVGLWSRDVAMGYFSSWWWCSRLVVVRLAVITHRKAKELLTEHRW
jgi:hypothetical protein